MNEYVVICLTISLIIFFIGILIYHNYFFPKKMLRFRIAERDRPSGIFYQAQIKKNIFGWTPFNVNIHNDSIWFSNEWGRERSKENEKINDYMILRGFKPFNKKNENNT